MEEIIKFTEKIPTNNENLKLICKPANVDFIVYDDLVKYSSIEDVLDDKDAVFILLQIHNSDGSTEAIGHWVLLLRRDEKIEYFDPLGHSHDDKFVIHITHEDPKILTKLLQGHNVIVNRYKFQKFEKQINVCGLHCACRVFFRGIPLDEYYKLMTSVYKKDPDLIVAWISLLARTDIDGDDILKHFNLKKLI